LVGARVAELLGKTVRVKLLEENPLRAEELSARLLDTEVLHGDGSDKEILTAAGLLDMDTLIATTGDNETNIMSCLLAKHLFSTKQNDPDEESGLKTICLVTNEDYLVLATTSGLDIAMNKKIMAGNEILTDIRRSELLSVSHVHGFDVEVVDILAARGSTITRSPLSQLETTLKDHIIIGSVFRDGKWETAIGSTHIQEGDRVIAICDSRHLKDVQTIFS
jgi:trk system potassium uptake protein TrkA